jgi:hypothetical protein
MSFATHVAYFILDQLTRAPDFASVMQCTDAQLYDFDIPVSCTSDKGDIVG